jgi:hypothetical protein
MEEREKVEVPIGEEDLSFLYCIHIYDRCSRSRAVVPVHAAVLALRTLMLGLEIHPGLQGPVIALRQMI